MLKKNQVLRDLREDSIGKIGIFVEDFGVSMSTLNLWQASINVFTIVDSYHKYTGKNKNKIFALKHNKLGKKKVDW